MNINLIFLDAKYDEETGISWASVKLDNRIYEATSLLLEEDKEKASQFAGCRFAEMKAELKAFQDLRRIEKKKCDEYRNFVKSLECYKNFDKESKTARCVYKQLNKHIQRVNFLTNMIQKKREDFLIAINQRDIVIKAINRKKAKES